MSTLEDIARQAGVSKSTVSRAMGDSPLISEKTRQRVKDIARAFNYQPDLRARSLRTRFSHAITLIIHSNQPHRPDLTDPFALKFIGLVGTELKKRGYDMLIAIADCREANIGNQYVLSGKSDGLIIFGRPVDDHALEVMVMEGVPLVSWGIPTKGAAYHSVGIDNIALTQEAVELLIQTGRRRIGFIGSEETCAEFGLRFLGYRNALMRAGLQVTKELVIEDERTERPGYWAMKKLIQGASPDAVFACSDVRALQASQAIREAGLSIPEDVAVIGFDNIELGKSSSPMLSTISQGISREGAKWLVTTVLRAIQVKKLVNEINNVAAETNDQAISGGTVQTIMVPGKFIARESCGSRSGDYQSLGN